MRNLGPENPRSTQGRLASDHTSMGIWNPAHTGDDGAVNRPKKTVTRDSQDRSQPPPNCGSFRSDLAREALRVPRTCNRTGPQRSTLLGGGGGRNLLHDEEVHVDTSHRQSRRQIERNGVHVGNDKGCGDGRNGGVVNDGSSVAHTARRKVGCDQGALIRCASDVTEGLKPCAEIDVEKRSLVAHGCSPCCGESGCPLVGWASDIPEQNVPVPNMIVVSESLSSVGGLTATIFFPSSVAVVIFRMAS